MRPLFIIIIKHIVSTTIEYWVSTFILDQVVFSKGIFENICLGFCMGRGIDQSVNASTFFVSCYGFLGKAMRMGRKKKYGEKEGNWTFFCTHALCLAALVVLFLTHSTFYLPPDDNRFDSRGLFHCSRRFQTLHAHAKTINFMSPMTTTCGPRGLLRLKWLQRAFHPRRCLSLILSQTNTFFGGVIIIVVVYELKQVLIFLCTFFYNVDVQCKNRETEE